MLILTMEIIQHLKKKINHGILHYVGGTSKKEEVKRLPGGKLKKKVSLTFPLLHTFENGHTYQCFAFSILFHTNPFVLE